jgi:hypothetical protein
MPQALGAVYIDSCESGKASWKFGEIRAPIRLEWGRRSSDPYTDLHAISWGRNNLRIKVYGLNQVPIRFIPRVDKSGYLTIRVNIQIESFFIEVNGVQYFIQKPRR